MNEHYEEINDNIKFIHDLSVLDELKQYNNMLSDMLYSIIVNETDKNIFECCREFMNYLELLKNVIDNQINDTINDMEYNQPADED